MDTCTKISNLPLYFGMSYGPRHFFRKTEHAGDRCQVERVDFKIDVFAEFVRVAVVVWPLP